MFSHTASWVHIARVIAVAMLATIACGGIPTSHAQDFANNRDAPSISVKYSDLDLATEAGSRVLYRRLEVAAERVCPQIGHVSELRWNRDARHCIAASIERAAKQIPSPQFAEVAASRLR